jgi:hypothetical protein
MVEYGLTKDAPSTVTINPAGAVVTVAGTGAAPKLAWLTVKYAPNTVIVPVRVEPVVFASNENVTFPPPTPVTDNHVSLGDGDALKLAAAGKMS